MDLKCIHSIFEDENKKRRLLEKYKPECSLKLNTDGQIHIIKSSISKIPFEKVELSKEVKYFENNCYSEDKLKTAFKSKGLTDLNILFSKKIFNIFNVELSESFNNKVEQTKSTDSKSIYCIHSIYISLIRVIIDEKDVKLKDTIINRFKDVINITDTNKKKHNLSEIYDIFGMFVPLEFTLGGKYNISFEVRNIQEKDNIVKNLNNLTNINFNSQTFNFDYQKNQIEEFNNEIKKSQYTISLEGGDITKKYNFEEWIKSLNIDNLEIIDFKTLVKIHDFCGNIKNDIDDIIGKDLNIIKREGYNQLGYCFSTPDIKMKIMLLGDAHVGKTSIINRLKSGTFLQFYQCTVSLDFVNIYRKININNKDYLIRCTFVDTAGSEIHDSLASSFVKQCDGFALIYNISDINGLKNIKKWKENIDNNSKKNKPPIILIGNKLDLNKKIQKYMAIQLSKELDIDFGDESSCKDLNNRTLENNIDILITKVAKNKLNDEEIDKNSVKVEKKKSSDGCC